MLFPGEGWTFEIHFLADVAFKRRTDSSEDFRHDESALGYLMKFLGLHFFSDLVSPMAYQINILIPDFRVDNARSSRLTPLAAIHCLNKTIRRI